MQSYLDLLNTQAYSSFDFSSVEFLEDADQGAGRAQAFVVPASAAGLNTHAATTPEPDTVTLLAGGLLLLSVKAFRFRKAGAR
jgi:hypothetical protein